MLDSLLRSLRSGIGRGGSRTFVLLGVGVVLVAGVWAVGQWAATPTYVSLYREIDLKDAGAMTDGLRKANIPFKLSDGGSTISVPSSEVARARVALAKDGLPNSSRPGLELFDKPSWGMTDFTQRVTFQRALEGELARTIGGLRGVDRAQVHLVLPERSAVRRMDRPASASVVLALKSGMALSPEEVQGIAYIVSNSVEQLAPDNVAIMDDAGRVLSAPTSGSLAGTTGRQIELQRAVERDLAQRVEDLLATTVGSGHARAEVAADLSFDQTEQTTETYDPDKQVLQTEQRSEGTFIPVEPEIDSAGTQTVVSNTYQNSRSVARNVSAQGHVARLTVAALVDEKAVRGGGLTGQGALSITALEAMVANAIGADSSRGDRVSVIAVPFDTSFAAAVAGTSSAKAKPDVMAMVERGSRPTLALIAIVALILIALQVVKTIAASAPAERPSEVLTLAGVPALAEGNGSTAALPPPRAEDLVVNEQLTAQVMRTWLADRP